MTQEKLGPAERIIETLLQNAEHLVHNRPGLIMPDATAAIGVRWEPVTHVRAGEVKVIYRLKGKQKLLVGTFASDGRTIEMEGQRVAEYRPAGLFPEVAAWMYRQIARVWQLDNEFAARWASFAYGQEHRDLKVALAAFMLVQSRKGDPVQEGGVTVLHDEDFRTVGEAMCLLYRKDGKDLNPKLLLRIRDLLKLPEIAEQNRALGFGKGARRPFLGRWPKAVEKWLSYREENPRLLEGLVNAGFRTTVMELARAVGFKPATPRFFEILRWKQKQATDGRRALAIGAAVKAADTWEELSEAQICERIVAERPGWKRLVALLPTRVGVSRAVVAAAMEAGALSDKDLVIMTPTLEELGLLSVPAVRERWTKATLAAEDMRAANIAQRVKQGAIKEVLEQAAERVVKRAVAEVIRKLRVYFFVDVSGSMEGAIEAAKEHVARFLGGFPPEQLHVAVFNTAGREVVLRHASRAGVEQAFRGITAGGGTDYGAGVRALEERRPAEDEDVLFIFVGDEEADAFTPAVVRSRLAPKAFGFVKVGGVRAAQRAVQETAAELQIPCFMVDPQTFSDPYAIPRTIRALIASTPVGRPSSGRTVARVSLVEEILKTALLAKPAWAA